MKYTVTIEQLNKHGWVHAKYKVCVVGEVTSDYSFTASRIGARFWAKKQIKKWEKPKDSFPKKVAEYEIHSN